MKVLFVCSANKDRSKTAEDYFGEQFPELAFESAGTNLKICRQQGTHPLTEEMLDWADKIFVMENKHRQWIKTNSKKKYDYKIQVLSIPDIYTYGQQELIGVLKEKAEPILKQMTNKQ